MFGRLNHGKVELDGPVTIVHGADAEVREYKATGVITAGDVLGLSTTGVAQATAGQALAIGVALETVALGDHVRVLIEGYVEGVNCANSVGTIALGEVLVMGATAGEIDEAGGAGTGTIPLGAAMAAEAGGKVAMYWFRK